MQKNNMIPQSIGKGKAAEYELGLYSTEAIHWVSKEEKRMTRIPNPREEKFRKLGIFAAAGRHYFRLEELCAEEGPREGLYRDKYGRKVFAFRERFPCFDSYDYLYEDRYYRWFFILNDNTLTRIHYTDQQNWIHVTEDTDTVECKCWEEMRKSGFWEWEG